MGKDKSIYVCTSCGGVSPKWQGKCPDCGGWNTMVEERAPKTQGGGLGAARKAIGAASGAAASAPIPIGDVEADAGARTSTAIGELDRVLGGGLVPGAVVLVGGDPGIGKSTVLLQTASELGRRGKVLYASGEESPGQIKLRAERLGLIADSGIMLMAETSMDAILATSSQMRPTALVVDSIQTMFSEDLESAPGSVGQVRECAARLMHYAKRTGVPVFIVGHVTKEGAIAGPRVLEHIVDTVLYFEGDRGHPYRVLRAVKNRFGSTNEIGVFEMTDAGLRGIDNPSELFLSERAENVPGSIVAACMEGTRPVLVEIQALASQTTFGTPRRTSIGLDYQRVNLLIAVLEKSAGLHLGGMDVFTNVVGGLRLQEPAVDLAVLGAVTSSLRERAVGRDVIVFGEVGLSGEIRAVGQADTRLKEAAKIGFKRAVLPEGNAKRLAGTDMGGIELIGVSSVAEATRALGL